MTLAKAKATANKTFIVQAPLTIFANDHQNIFIIQTPGPNFLHLFSSSMMVKQKARLFFKIVKYL
jgi:hypothetical protein